MEKRGFYIARKMKDGIPSIEAAYKDARLPEYKTRHSAGADFFCAEEVVVPSIWKGLIKSLRFNFNNSFSLDDENAGCGLAFQPTRVHTGVKASMLNDEVLKLYNRSSNPRKFGLILANGVGVVDADYFENVDNDGEIGFEFYNILPWDVKIKAGDSIGQGVFEKFLYPEVGCVIKDVDRVGGYGSTDKK